jgi:hypothetical protein
MCRSFELAQGFAMLIFQLSEVSGGSPLNTWMSSESRCDRFNHAARGSFVIF